MNESTPHAASVIKNNVMSQIMEGKVKMASPFSIFMTRLGIRSTIVFSIIASGLFLSSLLYTLKKVELVGFLSFGLPGLKVLLLSFPYDYAALFIISLLSSIYLYNQLDLPCKRRYCFRSLFIGTFLVSILIGIALLLLGWNSIIVGWGENRFSHDIAACGTVREVRGEELVVEEINGRFVRVNISGLGLKKSEIEQMKGKTLQAIGLRNTDGNEWTFEASNVRCVDEY